MREREEEVNEGMKSRMKEEDDERDWGLSERGIRNSIPKDGETMRR